MPAKYVERVFGRLNNVQPTSSGWTAECKGHDDRSRNSLSLSLGDDSRILLHCFAGCPPKRVVQALGLRMRHLFPPDLRRQLRNGAETAEDPLAAELRGLTLAAYAQAKQLPERFLKSLGLQTVHRPQAAVSIPYLSPTREIMATQFRLALEGPERFRWQKGSKPIPYGLWRLDLARQAGFIVLVEGPSDCHTLWFHEIPALGIPGAASWNEAWAAYLDEIPIIYVVVEPDRGGETVQGWLGRSALRERARLITLTTAKDPSALYLAAPENFRLYWEAALGDATPWQDFVTAAETTRRDELWTICAAQAESPDILTRFIAALEDRGVVGEERTAKLLYLIVTSRLLDTPVSCALKGPSSAGKSFLAKTVLGFFPPAAFYALSAMSARALAYSNEPLKHRVLVIYEAAGIQGDFANYLVRSLLSEHRIRYETVEKTPTGLRSRLIEREGPTGLIVTTTALRLHPENETRLFSIAVSDSPEHTRDILRALATRQDRPVVDAAPWHALQEWLALSTRHVGIPYAEALAEAIPPVAIRLRRDFGAILALIEAHTVLHQATRQQRDGVLVAEIEDYAAVRELVLDLVAEGTELSVSGTVRSTVRTVEDLLEGRTGNDVGITVTAVARALNIEKPAASRRVRAAINGGYLVNREERRFRPARLVLGEPFPEEQQLLPTPEALEEAWAELLEAKYLSRLAHAGRS